MTEPSARPFKELYRGIGGGLTGYLLCHPFDTVKTRLQGNPDYRLLTDLRQNGLLTLYRGLGPPLLSVVIEKAILFSAYDLIKRRTPDYSPLLHGLGAGLLTTLTVTPFERVKVRSQISNRPVMQVLPQILKNDGPRSLYTGWSATLMREVPGYMIYFNTYEMVKARYPDGLNPAQAFMAGALAGMSAWLFMYPSDPIKTVMQNQNVGVRSAAKQIWQQGGIRAFYRGLPMALLRSAILHGGVFTGYHLLEDI